MEKDELLARIVGEENGVLILNKPSGMPTSGRHLEDSDCLQYWLIQHYGTMVWAVHQLDADTSGINLFVRDKKGVADVKARMAEPSAEKRYLAVVSGCPDWTEKTVDAPIGMVDARSLGVHAAGKAARSHFRVLDCTEDAALLEARIETGRTHQIRIHLAHIGHPVLGEEWYGPQPCLRHPRQALHAWRMTLRGLSATLRLPPDLEALLVSEGLVNPLSLEGL